MPPIMPSAPPVAPVARLRPGHPGGLAFLAGDDGRAPAVDVHQLLAGELAVGTLLHLARRGVVRNAFIDVLRAIGEGQRDAAGHRITNR
ncbi:MAG: hypothetical protein MUC68_10365 [Burkholderiaceae bacterium]|nr:hypothetical protein [Burkholderiaceae bacterium]